MGVMPGRWRRAGARCEDQNELGIVFSTESVAWEDVCLRLMWNILKACVDRGRVAELLTACGNSGQRQGRQFLVINAGVDDARQRKG